MQTSVRVSRGCHMCRRQVHVELSPCCRYRAGGPLGDVPHGATTTAVLLLYIDVVGEWSCAVTASPTHSPTGACVDWSLVGRNTRVGWTPGLWKQTCLQQQRRRCSIYYNRVIPLNFFFFAACGRIFLCHCRKRPLDLHAVHLLHLSFYTERRRTGRPSSLLLLLLSPH